MLLAIFAILMVGALFYPKSRVVCLLSGILLLTVFSVVYFDGDVQTYRNFYETASTKQMLTHYEPLFSLLMYFYKTLGLPYVCLRATVGLFYIVCTYRFVRKATEYKAIAMVLLFIFPSIFFCSVMRSGMATGIMLNAIWTLVENKKNAKVKYVLGLLLAILFHYSSAVFAVFLFVDLDKDFRWEKTLWYFVATFVVSVVLNFTDIAYKLVSLITDRAKSLQWFLTGNEANLTGTIVDTLLIFANAVLSHWSMNICNKCVGYIDLSMKQIRLSKIAYNISMIMFLLVPFFIFASPFLRLSYMMTAICLCSWLNATRMIKEYGGSCFPVFLAVIIAMIFVWRIFVDLPYLKQGARLFGELLYTQYMIQ